MSSNELPHPGKELSAQSEILSNLAVGEKTDLVTLFKNKAASKIDLMEYLLILSPPPRRDPSQRFHGPALQSIDRGSLTGLQKEGLINAGLLSETGRATQKLREAVFHQAPTHTKKLFREHALLLRYIDAKRDHWQDALTEQSGLTKFSKASGLCKAGWFSRDGILSEKARAFLKEQDDKDFKYLSRHFTSQHASLVNLLSVHGGNFNETLYNEIGRSNVPWEKQLRAIRWMVDKNILSEDWRPTELATQLRLLKVPLVKVADLKEVDVKIEEYLRGGQKRDDLDRLKLADLPAHALESRIFRLRASGLITNELRPTFEFAKAAEELRIVYQSNKDPPWLRENRIPRLSDLTDMQRTLLITLATESPYLSLNQLKHHLEIPQFEIDVLVKGDLLRMRTEAINHEPVTAVALNARKTKGLLKEAGIEKPLAGKFQRGSHMRHDFMLWESLREFRKVMDKKQDKVVGVLHERAIYQAKTSANDNKGISTPDLVLKTESGGEYAFEYGNYKLKDMVRKINNFPQKNVVVFSSDAKRLDQYIALYEKQTVSQSVQKHVTWYFIPEIRL